ncbi:hypothetical protein C8A01DRAFT_16807 [Parachaetomium inaequale]|uniref:Uncharacterized protein n=1 Tax=Parachaetomium inaequale TaxID=2588326 RepID=A0AAN6PEK3_9PEZI|nr:hypothetical protein C8A01DRAFT_16807 [Parachaetomium inaequale]
MPGSNVSVNFRTNRVVHFEYQKGALEATIAQAAEKLGMSGTVVAPAISHQADQGNVGRSTWNVELRKPLVAGCEEIHMLRIRTSYTIPSLFGKKK